jgi:AcrR family transcriptional regulator
MAIDSDTRRQDIAAVTIDLIAREGLAAATIRRIAAEAGASTTAITHYFDDKEELFVWTFQVLSAEGDRRFEDAFRSDPADAIGALLTMVPWCPVNVRRWKAYLAFWDGAARNADLAGLLTRSTRAGSDQLRRLIAGRAAPGADPDRSCRLLSAIIQGLALQMLVDQANWNETRIRAALQEALDLCLTNPTRR